MSVTNVFFNHSNIFLLFITYSCIPLYCHVYNHCLFLCFINYHNIWSNIFSASFLLSYLTLLVPTFLFSYIKHTLVFQYYIHSMSVSINFWFALVTVFHYYPIFFLFPHFWSPVHRLFVAFTRISLDSFR